MAVRRFHGVVEDHDLLDHDRQEVVIVLEEVEGEALLTFPSGEVSVCTPACWPGRRGEVVCTGTQSRSFPRTDDFDPPSCALA